MLYNLAFDRPDLLERLVAIGYPILEILETHADFCRSSNVDFLDCRGIAEDARKPILSLSIPKTNMGLLPYIMWHSRKYTSVYHKSIHLIMPTFMIFFRNDNNLKIISTLCHLHSSQSIGHLQAAHILLVDDLSLARVNPTIFEWRFKPREINLCFSNTIIHLHK